MISTKGRYSIRILLDLAEHRGVGYTPIKDVAARQSISLKYVEKLMRRPAGQQPRHRRRLPAEP